MCLLLVCLLLSGVCEGRKEKFGGREMDLGTMQDEVVRQWPVSFWVRGRR